MSNIGYFPRIFALAHLPHKKTSDSWERINGDYQLVVEGEIPYGPLARLLLILITSYAVRNKTPAIYLGENITELLSLLDLNRDGRYIKRLKEQLNRLFNMKFLFKYRNNRPSFMSISHNKIIEFPLNLTLSKEFYFEITSNPIPICLDTISKLRQSSLSMDIYIWLTHRLSYLSKPTIIKFSTLSVQFGSSFKRQIDFRLNFIQHLDFVLSNYKAEAVYNSDSIVLCPGNTHISKKSSQNTILPTSAN